MNAQSFGIGQTISDRAQQQTIAFDGVAFITGDFCSCTFLPPGKVADFCGFQYLRDNDPTNMGHNTDFVTIIAYNILHLLDSNQFNQFLNLANLELPLSNQYVVNRFPLIKAFRRYYDNDMPTHATGLDLDTVLAWSAEKIYGIDGQISYERCKVMGDVVRNMTVPQIHTLDSLKNLNGVGYWPANLSDPMQGRGLSPAVSVLVMTYASEMYAWYAGSDSASTYFCPERQGTYFGSFYMKDIKAMGNPGYAISPNMTDSVGTVFLDTILSLSQRTVITSIVDSQRTSLYELVDVRDTLSKLLRGFMFSGNVDSAAVMAWSEQYGRLDGYISYLYATRFTDVGHSCSAAQMNDLMHLRDLDSFPCNGAYLYSQPTTAPSLPNTDFFFKISTGVSHDVTSGYRAAFPNPFSDHIRIEGVDGEAFFELTDQTGKHIWSGNNIAKHDFSGLDAGIYILKTNDRGSVFFSKMIKQ